ncbi:MAG: MFS transporter [Hyphomonadaceae bacterium]
MSRVSALAPTIAILMLAESVSALEVTMIYAALPKMSALFDDPSMAGWLLTGFMLASAASAAICGRLGDMYGRRRVLMWVLAAATLGSVVSAVSADPLWIIAGRTIQGVSGAILPLCYGLARERLAPTSVGLGVGFVGGTATICAGAGLILGGIITDYADWRLIFQICAVLGVLAIIAVSLLKDDEKRAHVASNDLLGGLLFVPAVFAALLAITYASRWGWSDPRILGLTAAGVLLLGAWVWRELSVASPLIDVRLFATPAIGLGNLIFAALGVGVMQAGFLVSVFGQQDLATGAGLGLSATIVGFLLLPSNAIGAITSPFVSKLTDRIGARGAIMIGAAIMSASYLVLASFNTSVPIVVLMLTIQGVGLSLIYISVPIAVIGAAPADRTSEATGLLSVTRAAAMGIGAQIIATLLFAGGGHDQAPSADDYQRTFLYVAASVACVILAAMLLPRMAGRKETHTCDSKPSPHRTA